VEGENLHDFGVYFTLAQLQIVLGLVSLRGANFATKQPKFMGGLWWWLKAYFKLGLLRRNRAAIRGPLLAMTK
jgi:hypothetical protein